MMCAELQERHNESPKTPRPPVYESESNQERNSCVVLKFMMQGQ